MLNKGSPNGAIINCACGCRLFISENKPSGRLRLFAGFPAVICGSAPGAALFFCAYEMTRNRTAEVAPPWLSTMLAASLGEMVACIIRVPCETVKQRAQGQPHLDFGRVLSNTLRTEGLGGMYRGYISTILRELPFSLIQYPVWESLKRFMERYNRSRTGGSGSLSKGQFALCGAMAGALAGACTTPFDVIKTRIMLAENHSAFSTSNVLKVMRLVYTEAGIRGLFAGLVPRVSLLAIGGSIFLGLYDITKVFWSRTLDQQ
ncbi:S-adenosylmethionine mitochondrial carrier protein [Taenia crassiceps]|uniref:S-adenosylmethionine mitochondrial carrier protein n=1 Tax=Taenia crassiceps TaxID=6207 RepID=A0ABR4QLB6_9CEST